MSNEDDLIDNLILLGALEVAGVDDKNGQFLYAITPKMKEVMPDLYDEHINHVNTEIMRLWEKGFVNIDFDSDQPVVKLSPKAHDLEQIATLTRDEQWSLEEIKRLLIG